MGVEIFSTPGDYKNWVDYTNPDKEVISVVVFDDKLVVTWKFV